ncbi:MAG: alpha/beta hydrolase [Phenylobacterium sp.]
MLAWLAPLTALAVASGLHAATPACRMGPPGGDSFCQVRGARLHLVDWGGRGPPLILLAGLNNSARIFDDLAPRLTGRHHVYAFTRRGFGLSEQTADGYEMAALSQDVAGLMDALGIARADIVGHSIAGGELSRVAADAPQRVRRLVYLDAAYDRSDVGRLAVGDPAEPRAPPAAALRDLATLADWRARALGFASPAIAADLRDTHRPGPDGLVGRTPRLLSQAVSAGDRAAPPRYERIQAPALALYAPKLRPEQVPPEASLARRRAAWAFSVANARPWMLREKARFEAAIGCGQAWEAPGAGHYAFLERPAATATVIEAFLATPDPCHDASVAAALVR